MFGVAPPLRVFVYDKEEEYRRSPLLAFANYPQVLIFKSRRLIQAESLSTLPEEHATLAHEAAHKLVISMTELLIQQAGISLEGRRLDTSGHVLAPDWLEEAVAMLAEKPVEGDWRLEHLRKHLGELIPLRQLLTMDHPFSSATVQRLAESQGKQILALTLLEVPEDLRALANMYYSQLLALGQYIWKTEGPQFFRTALDAAVRGEPIEAIIASAQRLPRTLEELESAYLADVVE